MSPPQVGHASGNSSPTRAISFAHAIRDVSCEGLAPAAQQSVPVPLAFCPERVRHVFLRENEPDPEGSQIGGRDRAGRQERRRGVTPGVVCSRHEDTVGHAGVEVDMVAERRAEAVQEGDTPEPRAGGSRYVAAVAGRADAAALAGECHDESRAARHADRAGEAEAEEPALEIAAEFVLNVCRHGPLGGFSPLEPALEPLTISETVADVPLAGLSFNSW